MKGLKVPKKDANDLIKLLLAKSLINSRYRISRDDKHVYIPLKDLKKVPDDLKNVQIVDKEFEESKNPPRSFMEILRGEIPEEKMESIKRSFDVIGDVVILEIPPELYDYRFKIGEAALEFTGRKSVYMKKGKVSGVKRTRELELIAGTDSPETVHTEYGSRIKVDVKKVYFSPRLANEREVVAKQVREGETVLDMFAGAGPFAVAIARHGKASKVYAVDINPDAVHYLKENAKINNAEDIIVAIEGDVREFIAEKDNFADHVIMNLPGRAVEFLDSAIRAVRNGGTIHYYEFSRNFKEPIEHLKDAAKPFDVRISGKRKVKSKSPGVWHIGIDAKIEKGEKT